MKFKDLKVGEAFRFAAELSPHFQFLIKGPWVKTGPKSYRHSGGMEQPSYRVGTANVKVVQEVAQ